MKNLMKLLPLVALTLLVSCGGGSKITKEEADCLVNNGGASCVEVEPTPTPEPTPEPTPAAGWESILDFENKEYALRLWQKDFFATSFEGYFIADVADGQGSKLNMQLNEDGTGSLEKVTDQVVVAEYEVTWELSADETQINIEVTSNKVHKTKILL